MAQWKKTRDKVLSGNSDANISFDDLCSMLEHMDFAKDIKASHHFFTREDIDQPLNLQPSNSNKKEAKPYQIKQVRNLLRNI